MIRKTEAEVMARKAAVELKARMTDYDDPRVEEDPSFKAGRFRGYLDALRWALGEVTEQKIVCQDKPTCPFGAECEGGWDSIDPQTGRLCRDALSRNFAKVGAEEAAGLGDDTIPF